MGQAEQVDQCNRGAFYIGPFHRLGHPLGAVNPHLGRFKHRHQDVIGRFEQRIDQPPPAGAAIEHHDEWTGRQGRGRGTLAQQREERLAFVGKFPIRLRILVGVLGDPLAGLVDRGVSDEAIAGIEHCCEPGLIGFPSEPELRHQSQLVVLDRGIGNAQVITRGVGIVDEARRNLDRDHAATALVVLFQDQHLLASLGEIGGGDQRVAARADHDDIMRIRHRTSAPLRRVAGHRRQGC